MPIPNFNIHHTCLNLARLPYPAFHHVLEVAIRNQVLPSIQPDHSSYINTIKQQTENHLTTMKCHCKDKDNSYNCCCDVQGHHRDSSLVPAFKYWCMVQFDQKDVDYSHCTKKERFYSNWKTEKYWDSQVTKKNRRFLVAEISYYRPTSAYKREVCNEEEDTTYDQDGLKS